MIRRKSKRGYLLFEVLELDLFGFPTNGDLSIDGSNTEVSLHSCNSSIFCFYIGYEQTCDLLPDAWMLLY